MSAKKKPRKPATTWPDALAAYFEHLTVARKADRTIDGQRRHLDHLRLALGDLPLTEVAVTDLRAYLGGLLTGSGSASKRPMSGAGSANVASSVRSFFSWLVAEDLLKNDPTLRLERPHVPKQAQPDVLTPKEVAKVMGVPCKTPRGLRDRAFLDLAYTCGLRRTEILKLDLGDVVHKEREVHVRHGKGSKQRIVPLPPSTFARIVEYLDDGRPSFVRAHQDSHVALFLTGIGRRMSPNTVKDLFAALRKVVKLTKPLSCHRLRHACAVHLLQGGANLRVIQQILGHEHLDTTAIYLNLDREEIRRSLILHHPRERLDVGDE